MSSPVHSVHVGMYTYLSILIDEGKSSNVVSSAFYGIKWLHNINDLVDPTESSIVKNILETAKNLNETLDPWYRSIEALPYAKGCLLFGGWALRLTSSVRFVVKNRTNILTRRNKNSGVVSPDCHVINMFGRYASKSDKSVQGSGVQIIIFLGSKCTLSFKIEGVRYSLISNTGSKCTP